MTGIPSGPPHHPIPPQNVPWAGATADTQLTYIAELSRSTRTTWFALLGALVFCVITLMGMKDADFFGFRAETPLPIVGVSVPTERFFLAAPIALLGLYGYLHLSLAKLWEALAQAPKVIHGLPLRRAVFPWFMMDLGLRWRGMKDAPFGWLASLSAQLLAWWASPLVLLWFWSRSMPKHDEWLTIALGACMITSLWIGWRSYRVAASLLKDRPVHPATGSLLLAALAMIAVSAISWIRTEGAPDQPPALAQIGDKWLAPTNLASAVLADRPENWTDYELAETQFEGIWAQRQRTIYKDAVFDLNWRERAHDEFARNRAVMLAQIPGSDFGGSDDLVRFEASPETYAPTPGADLRRANLSDAFAPGVSFLYARLGDADLTGMVLEGADLSGADLRGAILSRIKGALLKMIGTQAQDTVIVGAKFTRADLTAADLSGARLDDVDLSMSDLSETRWTDTRVALVNFDGAVVFGADLSGAKGLSQRDLHRMLGDAASLIPPGLCRPDHWLDETVKAGDVRNRRRRDFQIETFPQVRRFAAECPS
ncbi:MAG: pentapeptide repeat-containing protein [Neomegalonema sp.]|nr:pentapeptide repeat-containing protein [Neomegalonema sp.]